MSELEGDNKNKRNWEKKEKEETKESGARVKIFNATPPFAFLRIIIPLVAIKSSTARN